MSRGNSSTLGAKSGSILTTGADYLGFGIKGLWLIVVYWVTIGLAVMILGAHQFHLKVAANAVANPGSALTIGELINKRQEYQTLRDIQGGLETSWHQASDELQKLQGQERQAVAEGFAKERAAQIAAQRLVRAILATPTEATAVLKLPEDFQNQSGRDLAAWAIMLVRSDEARQLYGKFEEAEEKAQAARIEINFIEDTVRAQQRLLSEIGTERLTKNSEMSSLIKQLTATSANRPNSGLTLIGLLYELDSFSNLWFFWLGQADPIKFVTLPGSVLTLLLALSMGALGSTLFVTGEYFKNDSNKTFAWYFFRPFLGMITALAVFVAFKAGQLTLAGSSPNSGVEMDLNPFLVSFFAVIAGLLSEHAIARLSMIGRDWLDRLGKEDAMRTKAASEPATAPLLYAKEWEARFGGTDGKSFDGLVEALHADPARVGAWMEHREPVPVEFVDSLVKYFGATKDDLFSEGGK